MTTSLSTMTQSDRSTRNDIRPTDNRRLLLAGSEQQISGFALRRRCVRDTDPFTYSLIHSFICRS